MFSCSSQLQQASFDYAEAWEEVYRLELRGLPRSASKKVDSIYSTAVANEAYTPQRIKAVIYQSKFLLLLQEDAQQQAIDKLKTEIDSSPKPVSYILEHVLASSYLRYYFDQRYKISQRTATDKPEDDFKTWDQKTFLSKIGEHFSNALDFDSAYLLTPVADYEEILTGESEDRIYRPLLIDLLAHEAIGFYSGHDTKRGRPSDYFRLDDTNFISPSADFSRLELDHADSASFWLNALRIYQKLTLIHEGYGSDEARIHLELGRRSFVHRHNNLQNKDSLYLSSLERLKAHNGSDSASTLVDYSIAQQLDDLGNKYSHQKEKLYRFKKAEARQVCLGAIESFPESFGAGQCAALIKSIERPSLQIRTEKHLLPNRPAKMLIDYKEQNELKFVTYHLSLNQLDSILNLEDRNLSTTKITNFEVAQSWASRLKNEGDYQRHSTEVLFPPHAPGAYLVLATSATDHKQLLATATVLVTNLALVYDYNGRQRVYRVVNRQNGAAVPGVKVHLKAKRRNYANSFVNRDFISDENGEFSFANPNVYVDLKITLDDGREKTVLYDNYLSRTNTKAEVDKEERYYAGVQLFTDRSIYRPGQEVFFKALLMKQLRTGSKAVSDEVLFVSLLDPNGETVETESFETNEFGSVAGSFKLPSSGMTGFYRLKVENHNPDSEFFNNAESFNDPWHGVSVEEYKRPRFEVDFEPVEGLFSQGDSIWAKGRAIAFAGSNLTNVPVKYTVTRSRQYYRGYGYSSDDVLMHRGESLTDEEGGFKIPFVATFNPAVKKSEWPVFVYEVIAEVTDTNGETRTATTKVKAGYHTLDITLKAEEKISKHTDKATFMVDAKSLNGSPQQAQGTLNVFKLQGPSYVKRPKPWSSPDYPGFTREEHDKLFPHFPYSGEGLSTSWPKQKRYVSQKISGENQSVVIDDLSAWPPGKYLVEFISSDRGREVIKKKTFVLTDPELNKVADNQRFYIKTDKPFYLAGDTAIIRYGTAAADMVVNLSISKRSEPIEKFAIHLHDEIRTLKIPITKQDEGGFGVLYDYTLFNTSQHDVLRINVPEQHPLLQISTGTFRNKLRPGEKEQWSFTIKGKDTDKVSAEVLASMYDASLDQFVLNPWRLDAFMSNDYRPYHSFNTLSSFETRSFTQSIAYPRASIPRMKFERLNRFGMAFTRTERAQNRYLSILSETNSSRLVLGSVKKEMRSGIIQGAVMDAAGQPFKGVEVSVRDTKRVVKTDSTGRFELQAKPGQRIVFSEPGYRSLEWTVGNDNYLEVRLLPYGTNPGNKASDHFYLVEIPDEEELYEVAFDMVAEEEPDRISYRARPDSKDWTPRNADTDYKYSFSTSGEMPGLIIIDGVEADVASIRQEEILSTELLNPAQAMAIYGERGGAGALIITTKKGMAAQSALLAKIKTRTNLKETAFFFPQLKTNSQGEVSFQFDSPESLSRWNLQLLAHNKELASDILRRTVVTQKELMIVPNPPRFFREGDRITFSAKLASLTTNEMNGTARLELYDELTGKLLEGMISGSANQSFRLVANGNTSLSWQLSIPEGVQAIRYKIVAATNDFSDGEENVIPVLSNRKLVQESVPIWARSHSTKTFSLDKLKTQNSASLKHHNLTLTMTTNPVWEAVQNLPYLMEYPYECAEQTFARYYANKLGSYLLESFPVIRNTFDQWAASGAPVSRLEQNQELKALLIEETPWLREAKSQAEQQKRLAELFESARMQEQLESSLDKLRKIQLSSGGFPWFSGSERPNLYITQHIIAGLAHLKKLTGGSEFQDIIVKGQSYMNKELIRQYEDLSDRPGFNQADKHIDFFQIQYLYTRSLTNAGEASEELAEALAFFEKQAFSHWLQMDLQSQAMIAMYAKKKGNDDMAEQIIASLKEYSIVDEEKGIYWKNNVTGWYNWEAPIETQALLTEAFLEITDDQTYHDGMRQWLLAEKRTKSWKSTKATTEALYALLYGGLGMLSPNNSVKVSLGGEPVPMDTIGEESMGAGYFKETWQAADIKPEMANLVIENGGNTVVFGGLHWQYFEDLDKITQAMGPLSLEKKLFLVGHDASGEVLKEIGENTELALGDLIRVRIVLRSDRSMEFIHLKDMRAAGFEPVNVLSGYRWQDGLGYYESTRDAATNFFIEYLPKGIFVFEYDLRVNNEGNFSNGITSIQNMYAPEFSSHSEGIRVVIGNK